MPIWNWYKLHRENDFKYMLKGIDYTQKIKVSIKFYKELKANHQRLIADLEYLDLSVLRAKVRYQVKLMELVKELALTSLDPVKLDKAYNIVLGLMITDEPEIKWLFDVDFTETQSQRAYLTEVARVITEYNNKRGRKVPEQSLNEKIVKIETILNVRIDPMTCPVLLFKEYERQAIERVNLKNKELQ